MMGTNDAGDSGGSGQSGSGGGDPYPPYPGTPYPGTPYPGTPYPGTPYPGAPYAGQSGGSYSGYREGVDGEPVPETAWQNPHPSSQQSPYPPYPPQQPPYPPYGGGQYPGPYPYPVARPTNGMAVASLVLGILWIYWIGSILSLIFGYIARQQIRERGEGGDGMAVAGIVLGWIGVGVLIIFIAIFVIAGASNGFR